MEISGLRAMVAIAQTVFYRVFSITAGFFVAFLFLISFALLRCQNNYCLQN